MSLKSIAQKRKENVIYDLFKNFGTHKKYVEVIEVYTADDYQKFARREVKRGDLFYTYQGPLDEKTREFCRKLLKLNKVWTIEEIGLMSTILDYNVFRFHGSYNCRHFWSFFLGKVVTTPPPTDRQIDSVVDSNIHAIYPGSKRPR